MTDFRAKHARAKKFPLSPLKHFIYKVVYRLQNGGGYDIVKSYVAFFGCCLPSAGKRRSHKRRILEKCIF